MCENPKSPILLLRLTDNRYMLMRADCKTYACPTCGKVRKSMHYLRILSGASELHESTELPLCFVTLTSNPKLKTYAATKRVFPLAWKKLSMRWKREQSTLDYAMSFENHKDGRLHAHMIVLTTVSQHWIKDNAYQCGLGYMAKKRIIRSDDNLKQHVGYVAKYATKHADGSAGRNINYSQSYPKLSLLQHNNILEIWRYETLAQALQIVDNLGLCEIITRNGDIVDIVNIDNLTID